MRSDPAFVSHCLELLAPLGAVHARRMFGGHGLYVDDVFIALISDERLYLKTDDASRAAFERAACEPFAYSKRDRSAVTLSYWTAPDEALDSPRAMEPWARLALAAALRARAAHAAPTVDKPRRAAAKASKARAAKLRG
ncbi:MAG TPA: TfoX/Sxy family protein [Burkholderiaceae bacterium]|nr:TfoX/Sxy family protein [Burkholderiaceae bacterium]